MLRTSQRSCVEAQTERRATCGDAPNARPARPPPLSPPPAGVCERTRRSTAATGPSHGPWVRRRAAQLVQRLLDSAILKSCSSVFEAFDEGLLFREQLSEWWSLKKQFNAMDVDPENGVEKVDEEDAMVREDAICFYTLHPCEAHAGRGATPQWHVAAGPDAHSGSGRLRN